MNMNLKQRATQMINQPTMRMIQRRKELLGRRGLKKQAPIMTYPKVIEKKYQAELINFVNVISKEIDMRLIESLNQIDNQRKIELNLDSWVDSVDDIMESLKVWGIAKASEMLAVVTLKASQIGDWNTKQFKQSIKTVVGVDPISKNQGYQTLIQSWSKENSRLITSIQSNLLDDVAGVTQRGMSAGKSINDISKEIKDRYGVTKSRARTIARTETAKLNGNLTKVRNQELGIKTYFWATSNDGERVRPSHRALNGMLCKWDDDSVYSDDGGKSWKRRSGKMFIGKPGDDFQCFPEYEKLTGTPLPYKLYRRDYNGQLIKINLANGKSITATPNHPIATNRGIIPIKDITKIDYIIGKSQEMCSFTKFNGKHFIPTFGQIFSSLCDFGVSFSVSPDKRSQFHGDGSYGKINIIDIDSLLINVRNSLFNEKLPKFGFTESDMIVCDALFSSSSYLYSSFKARGYTESSIVSSLDLICSLFESHLTPLEQFALALGSDADIIISKSFSNSISTNSIMFRDRIFAFSTLVFGYNFVSWQRDNFFSRTGKFIDSYATSFEVFADSCGTKASFLRNTCNSIPESVEFDKVVDISLFDYDGHVFNLSNISGYYTVNNLNVSNCRCTSRSNVSQLLDDLGLDDTTKQIESTPTIENAIEEIPKITFGYDGKFDKYVEDIRPEASSIFAAAPKPTKIIQSKYGYYETNKGVLSTTNRRETFIHEYGHHIDTVYGGSWSSKNADELYKLRMKDAEKLGLYQSEDREAFLNDFAKKYLVFDEDGFPDVAKTGEYSALSDLIDSATMGYAHKYKNFIGHGTRYYSGNRVLQANEDFANMFALWSNNKDGWVQAKKMFPSTTKEFEKRIQEYIEYAKDDLLDE